MEQKGFQSYQHVVWHALRNSPPGVLCVQIDALPPGINSQYGVGRGRAPSPLLASIVQDDRKPRVYLTAQAEDWAEKAALVIGAEAGVAGWELESINYGVLIIFSGSRMDVDAPVKLVIDTLTRKLGFDDRYITEQASIRLDSKEKRMLIVLYPCDEIKGWFKE